MKDAIITNTYTQWLFGEKHQELNTVAIFKSFTGSKVLLAEK